MLQNEAAPFSGVGRAPCLPLPGLAFLFVLAFLWPRPVLWPARSRTSSMTAYRAISQGTSIERWRHTRRFSPRTLRMQPHTIGGDLRTDDLGEHQKALEDLSKAVEIDNKYADAFNNRGEVFRKMGKLAEALKDYQTAARLDASFAEAHYNMALVYEAQNKKADAAREYRKYAELKPDAKDKEQVLSVAKALEAAPKGQPTPGAPGKGGQPGQMARPKPTKPGQQEVAEGGMTPSATGQQGQKPRSPRTRPNTPQAWSCHCCFDATCATSL